MKIDEIREVFLDFFKKKGHTVVRSDSLVPQNDPSLLFTSAGMNQFKELFLGKGAKPYTRATSCQKCLRTGDLDIVGTTAKHHTFFEMLGNFSFGDYFKEEAIAWGWEFLTKRLGLSESRLYASIHDSDDEAYMIWKNKIRLSEKKIFKFGDDSNFWPANARTQGPNGPCGPCSEIYYDFGSEHGCGKASCMVGCDCDRYVEVWNLVFTQYNRQEGGILVPLSQKNIDTGMGLERVGAVMQNCASNFDTDVFKPIVNAVAEILGKQTLEEMIRIRRISDHVRAITFLVSDGVIPSNEERGYVARRVLRMAVKDGYVLGSRGPFMHQLIPVVIGVMSKAYPQVRENQDHITRIIKAEEEKFRSTIEIGIMKIKSLTDQMISQNQSTLAGEEAFALYDTHGFPVELTESMLADQGLQVDQIRFKELLEQSRERSRKQAKFGEIFEKGPLIELKQKIKPTEFLGYTDTASDSTLLAVIREDASVDKLEAGEVGIILIDRTPFYGEQGGQIGDTGTFIAKDAIAQITDTKRDEGYFLHYAKVSKGVMRVGDKIHTEIERERRMNIMRNHTGTHLLQAALRTVLGPHVKQTGSIVEPHRLRFDFTHFEAMTDDQIMQVEKLINDIVMNEMKVEKIETSFDEAKKMGALMFFGEKYGDRVRVIKVGDFSIEFCGGTHLNQTSTIGFFKVTQETSIGSGMRRIEAVTGPKAVELALEESQILGALAEKLKASKGDVTKKVDQLLSGMKSLSSQLERFKKEFSQDSMQQILNSATVVNGEKIISFETENRSSDEVRSLIDALIKKQKIACAMIKSTQEGKTFFIVGVRGDIVGKGLKAGEIAKKIASVIGTSGGGKDHIAQFGGSESSVAAAFREFSNIATETLNKK